jgi:hypothetical protein
MKLLLQTNEEDPIRYSQHFELCKRGFIVLSVFEAGIQIARDTAGAQGLHQRLLDIPGQLPPIFERRDYTRLMEAAKVFLEVPSETGFTQFLYVQEAIIAALLRERESRGLGLI